MGGRRGAQGEEEGKDVGRWLRDTGGSEVHRREEGFLRHSGARWDRRTE